MTKIKHTKITKKSNGDVLYEPKIDTDTLEAGNVYMFHNTMFNINLFVNANGVEQAMEKFDMCCFGHRENWKIFLELSHQPAKDKNDN